MQVFITDHEMYRKNSNFCSLGGDVTTNIVPFIQYKKKFNQPADIMVMLDNSWSIGKTNYAFQKEFLFKFIERLGILVLYGCFFEVVLVVFVVSTSVAP